VRGANYENTPDGVNFDIPDFETQRIFQKGAFAGPWFSPPPALPLSPLGVSPGGIMVWLALVARGQTLPPLSTLTSRAIHAHPTSPRSTGFCAIWDCTSSSSSSGQPCGTSEGPGEVEGHCVASLSLRNSKPVSYFDYPRGTPSAEHSEIAMGRPCQVTRGGCQTPTRGSLGLVSPCFEL